MNYILFFTEDARGDIHENYSWYEKQRKGLGDAFFESLNKALEKIKEHPLQYQFQYKEQRAALLNRFPFRIFYFIDHDKIIIHGVIRTSRDPKIWKGRNT